MFSDSRSKTRLLVGGVLLLCAVPGLIGQTKSTSDKAWDILNAGVKETSFEKRAQSVAALGLITKDKTAQAMAETALTDPRAEVRAAAANALGDMLATSAVPKLMDALQDKDGGVVVASAHALHVLKQAAAYEVYYSILTGERKSGEGLIAEQKKMLSDPKKMAQFGFEQGIGFIPFAGLGYGAIRAITKDEVSPVRASAARVLAQDPDEKSGEALVKAASDKSWIVRVAALDALAHRGDRSMAEKIEPRLDDPKPIVKFTAAAAVIHLSKPAGKTGK